MSKKIADYLLKAKKRDNYWIEDAKIEFALSFEHFLDKSGMNKAELAKRLDVSPAYISKVLRGDANVTIETMVKLIRAVGASKLSFQIVREDLLVDDVNCWLGKVSSIKQGNTLKYGTNVAFPTFEPSNDLPINSQWGADNLIDFDKILKAA